MPGGEGGGRKRALRRFEKGNFHSNLILGMLKMFSYVLLFVLFYLFLWEFRKFLGSAF